MAERRRVPGSRPASRATVSSFAKRSAARSGDALDRLNSSANRTAIRIERGLPSPPTMIGGAGSWTGRGRRRPPGTW